MMDTAFHAGQEARFAGLDRSSPFIPSGPFGKEWLDGWDNMEDQIKTRERLDNEEKGL